MTLLEVQAVSHRYGSRVALDAVSLSLAPGEIAGLIGPNGAGKTTLLRLVAGDLRADSGSLTIAGHRAGTRTARRLLGYAGDPPVSPPELSALEWLRYLASHRARSPAERVDLVQHAIGLAELGEFAGRRIAGYSRGMAQRLALAAAAVCGPRLVLLDEVLSGADPLVARRLRDGIGRLAAEGRGIVIASHDLATVERLATRVLVLVRGRLVREVAMAALLSERVAELVLPGNGLSYVGALLQRFAGAVRTGAGADIPLTGGLTLEQVLAECRALRIAVAASRVRYRGLEDILLEAAGP
jgi:ABC-type multidrug transport system ATPase subunit